MSEVLKLTTESPSIVLVDRTTPEEDATLFELFEENHEHMREPTDTEDDPEFFPTLESVTQARLSNPLVLNMGIWKDHGVLVGEVVAVPKPPYSQTEIGYLLREDALGNGYATMAVKALTDHLVQNNCKRVFANVHEANPASVKVVKRAGFIEAERTASGLVTYEYGSLPKGQNDSAQSVPNVMNRLAASLGVKL